ncbi:MAG: OmpA family protein [Thermodesulfobacteriota bacterium]|nr:OmpA family protein [Thermodesulfobacteriota bacterium]
MKRCLIVVIMVFVCSFALICLTGCSSQQVVRSDVDLAEISDQQAREAAALAEKADQQAREAAALAEKAFWEQLLAEADSFRDIHFSFDKYDLNMESRNTLGQVADWMLEHPDFEITINGHCDNRGTIAYNLALGERRAEAAKAYLLNLGVSGAKITTISYGEELPIDPRNYEAAWAKNRRDHFILFPQK